MTDQEKVRALLRQQYEVDCLLAEALGYPYDREAGWVTGDHTIVTLAMEVRNRGVLPTREALALAYHRYHCHADNPHTCTAVDQDDYDYADALAEVLAVGNQGGLT